MMFTPKENTERYDRNIFTVENTSEPLKLKFKPDTPILFYYKSDVVVGYLSGKHEVRVYGKFTKNGYFPISVMHNRTQYCGWVAEASLMQ